MTALRSLLPVAALLAGACAPSIASRAYFPTVEGTVSFGGPAALTPTPDRRGLRMTCTGPSCTACDVELDIQVYRPVEGSRFASFRTQGPMHGKVEMLAITFPDSVSLPQAGEILTEQFQRRPVTSDSLHMEWSDGKVRVRLVKARGRAAGAVISAIPRPPSGPGCPAK